MRSLVGIWVLAAACGGGKSPGTIDAAADPDGDPAIDAARDAPGADAPFSGPGTPCVNWGVNGIAPTSLHAAVGLPGGTNIPIAARGSGVVAVGHVNGALALEVHLEDGALDPAFGTNGVITHDPSQEFDEFGAVDVYANGSVVAAGFVNANDSGNRTTIVGKFTATGPDPTFDTDGFLGVGPSLEVPQVFAGPGDRVMVVTMDSQTTTRIARYTSTGVLDPDFGTNGVVTLALTNARAALLRPLGTMTVLGVNAGALQVIQLDGSGDPVTSFGTAGIAAVGPTPGTFHALVQHFGGAFATVQWAGTAGDYQLEVTRFTSTGMRDPAFGTSGQVSDVLASSVNFTFSPAIDVSNRIVVATEGILRLATDGTRDEGFGPGGLVTDVAFAQSLALLSDGRILFSTPVPLNGTHHELHCLKR